MMPVVLLPRDKCKFGALSRDMKFCASVLGDFWA